MTEQEVVDIVDTDDTIQGETTLDQCYRRGLLHRAVTIYCWNDEGKVLLQRRSLKDDWFPGYWTASCTGHVKRGESWSSASVRELHEELGLESCELSLLFKYVVPPIRYEGLLEYEMMYVLETQIGKSKIQFDRAEVEEVKFFGLQNFKFFFERNTPVITPDALNSYRRYAKIKGI